MVRNVLEFHSGPLEDISAIIQRRNKFLVILSIKKGRTKHGKEN